MQNNKNNVKKASNFQFRWNEALGEKDCPYAYRWVLIAFGYSLRIHHFVKSEPMTHFHNHSWKFITLCIKGGYIDYSLNEDGTTVIDKFRAGSIRFRKAQHLHKVILAKNTSSWTILFCFKPFNKWGFWVKNRIKRPLDYFSKFGHFSCE